MIERRKEIERYIQMLRKVEFSDPAEKIAFDKIISNLKVSRHSRDPSILKDLADIALNLQQLYGKEKGPDEASSLSIIRNIFNKEMQFYDSDKATLWNQLKVSVEKFLAPKQFILLANKASPTLMENIELDKYAEYIYTGALKKSIESYRSLDEEINSILNNDAKGIQKIQGCPISQTIADLVHISKTIATLRNVKTYNLQENKSSIKNTSDIAAQLELLKKHFYQERNYVGLKELGSLCKSIDNLLDPQKKNDKETIKKEIVSNINKLPIPQKWTERLRNLINGWLIAKGWKPMSHNSKSLNAKTNLSYFFSDKVVKEQKIDEKISTEKQKKSKFGS